MEAAKEKKRERERKKKENYSKKNKGSALARHTHTHTRALFLFLSLTRLSRESALDKYSGKIACASPPQRLANADDRKEQKKEESRARVPRSTL